MEPDNQLLWFLFSAIRYSPASIQFHPRKMTIEIFRKKTTSLQFRAKINTMAVFILKAANSIDDETMKR